MPIRTLGLSIQVCSVYAVLALLLLSGNTDNESSLVTSLKKRALMECYAQVHWVYTQCLSCVTSMGFKFIVLMSCTVETLLCELLICMLSNFFLLTKIHPYIRAFTRVT